MGKGEHLGEFEQLVLLATARSQGHGAAIHEELHESAGRDVSIASVYVTLNRLESKGYVRASVELAGEERGGRPRKAFAVTPAGVRALQEARLMQDRLWRGLDFDPSTTDA